LGTAASGRAKAAPQLWLTYSAAVHGMRPLQEMFVALGRQLDREVDDIAPLLLKKAGEVSNAGERGGAP